MKFLHRESFLHRERWAVESGDKDGTSEELKTQINVSRESHAMAMDAVRSGEARDVTIAGPDVQNSDPVVRVLETANAKDGVSEHLPASDRILETGRSCCRRGETDELEREIRGRWGWRKNTEVYMTNEGRRIGWQELGKTQAD